MKLGKRLGASVLFFAAITGGGLLRDSFTVTKALNASGSLKPKKVAKTWRPQNEERKPELSRTYLAILDTNGSERVLSKLSKLRSRGQDSLALARADLLIAAGAINHPEEILAFLLEPSSVLMTRTGMPTLFNIWAKRDKKGALDAIRAIESPSERRVNELRLIHALARYEPKQVFELLESNPLLEETSGKNMTSLHYEVFRGLGELDFDSALGLLGDVEPGLERRSALQGLAIAATDQDIIEAIDWSTGSSVDLQTKGYLLSLILRRGMISDGAKTLQALEDRVLFGDLNAAELAGGASSNLRELVDVNFEKTFNLIRICVEKDTAYSELLDSCFAEYCRQKPSEAIEALETIRQDPLSAKIMDLVDFENSAKISIAQSQAQYAPENFRVFLDGIDLSPSGTMADTTRYLLFTQGSSFAEYLNGQENLTPNEREEYLTSWVSVNPEQAINWIENLPEGQQRDALKAQFDTQTAITKPHEYAELLSESDYTDVNRKLTQIVAGSLTVESPEAAANWAENIQDQRLFEHAVGAVSKNWLRQDSHAAGEWIKSLPVGDAQKIAIRNLVEVIKNADPIAARMWAESIGESELVDE